jgi:hypothetical protein
VVGSDCSIRHRAAPAVASAGQRLDGVVRPAYRYVAIAVVHADAAMTGAVGAPGRHRVRIRTNQVRIGQAGVASVTASRSR